MGKEKMKIISLQISESVFEILNAMARKNQGSLSREIRVAITEYILRRSGNALADEEMALSE